MTIVRPSVARRHGRIGVVAALALFASVPALAQEVAGPDRNGLEDAVTPPGGQMIAPASGAFETQVDQLTPRRRGTDADQQVARPQNGAAPPVAQVSPRSAPSAAARQLTTDRPSAAGAAPISRPGDSPPQAVVRLEGKDACDRAGGRGPTICARVIETRSGEFARAPVTPLSAEQRLLIDQRLREMPSSAQGAANRVARNEIDPDAEDVQSIAAISLPTLPSTDVPTPLPDPAAPVIDSLGAALIQAIVERAQSGTPR